MFRLYYISFKAISSAGFFFRRRLTAAGWLALTALVATATLGLDTNKNTSYQIFMFILVLFIISTAWSRFFRASYSVRRLLPKYGTAGQSVPYGIVLTNTGGGDLRDCVLLEGMTDPRPCYEDFRNEIRRSAPGIKKWIWTTERWRRLTALNSSARTEKLPLPGVKPNGRCEVRAEMKAIRRGRVDFESVTICRPDPFGLTYALRTISNRQALYILPRRYLLPDIKLPGNRAYQHGGVALSTSVADSEEFQSLREYRPGDPMRQIHWKSWARSGKPIVKEYQDEFFVRHALVLDTFMNEDDDEVFEEAVSVAASFAYTVSTRESLLDMMFIGKEAYCETIGRGQGSMEHLLEVLACVRPCAGNHFPALKNLVLSKRASMSGCVCVFQSWDEERKVFADRLMSLGVKVMIIVIVNPSRQSAEEMMNSSDRPPWLHFIETGRAEEGLAKL